MKKHKDIDVEFISNINRLSLSITINKKDKKEVLSIVKAKYHMDDSDANSNIEIPLSSVDSLIHCVKQLKIKADAWNEQHKVR